MAILFDLHTHTHYSDGKSSVDDNISAALQKGIVLGISDHGPGHPWYGIRKKNLAREKEDIVRASQSSNAPILQGIEANIMAADGSNDLDDLPTLDYVLIGHHKGIFPRSFFSTYLMMLKQIDRDKARRIITEATIACMDDPRIDVITHPGAYVPVDMPVMAAAAREKGVLIELNQRHPLSLSQAREAQQAGATFLLSSDAHRGENIGRVPDAEAVAKAAGIPPQAIVNSPEYRWDRDIRLHRLCDMLVTQREQ